MDRICKKCGDIKPIEEFKKDKACLYGKGFTCKDCSNLRQKEYRKKRGNRYLDKQKLYRETYYKLNKDEISNHLKKHYQLNKDTYSLRAKKYYNKNKDEIINKTRKWYNENKSTASNQTKKYRLLNHEHIINKERKEIKELADNYIISELQKKYGIPAKMIRQYLELIENHRQQIKIKRLLKQKKNENNETS